jgi:hypothetical protein
VFAGELPFDESTMLDEDDDTPAEGGTPPPAGDDRLVSA